mmetsp:Transcript_86373/g.247868  ORF Transcript_86373/g.247868 Transcript_86373/m.247868 type:complete len:312 (-) Transcript_86373:95-1030(-)
MLVLPARRMASRRLRGPIGRLVRPRAHSGTAGAFGLPGLCRPSDAAGAGSCGFLLPCGLAFSAFWASGCRPAPSSWCQGGLQTGEEAAPDEHEHCKCVSELRRSVLRLRGGLGLDTKVSLAAVRAMYRAAARESGQLKPGGLASILGGAGDGRVESVSELVSLIFRLLDASGDGRITEQEFMVGYALILAAQADKPAELSDVFFRAIDADGNGILSRDEVATAVKLMLRVNAVSPQDKQEVFAEIKRNHGAPRRLHRDRSQESLVEHYMNMYDANKDGSISKAEFDQQGALQEAFFSMLTKPELEPLFAPK